MIKLLSIGEIGKQDYLKRQQGKQPEKTSEGILGLKSKLPFGCNYRFNVIIRFGFYPVDIELNTDVMNMNESNKKEAISEKRARLWTGVQYAESLSLSTKIKLLRGNSLKK
jgi:hypothetical protein